MDRQCTGDKPAISGKLFASILFLLLFGIGNAWGATTGTITFGSGSGDLDISSSSVYGNDSQSNRWDVTVTGSSVYYGKNADWAQVGSGDKPATSITFEMNLASSQTISAFSISLSGFSATRGRVNLKIGSAVIGTDTVSGSSAVNITNTTWTSGTKLTVEIINITAGFKLHSISYTYGATMQTVSWQVNKGSASGSPTTSVPNGAKVLTLPTEPTSSDCDGSKVFVGWSATELDDPTDTRPSDLFKTQASAPAVTGTTTYYAVFATSTAGAGDWELYTESTIAEGDYLIVQSSAAMTNTVNSTKLVKTSVTVSDNKIDYSDKANWTAYLWHIKETATSGVYTIKNGDNYVIGTGSASQADLAASPTDNKELFAITYQSTPKTYKIESKYNESQSENRWLRNGGAYFACYADGAYPSIYYRGAALSAYATTCCTNKIAAPSVEVTKTAYTVSLSWSMASGVSKYEVQWNGGDWEEVTSSISKSSLSPNTEYAWKVRAKTWSGDECGVEETVSSTTTNQVYTVTYAAGTGGSGTMTDSNSPYEAGDEVTVKTSDGFSKCGSHFDGWTYSPAQSVTDGKFTMPSSNVTITATWAANDNDVYYDWMSSVETSTNKSGSYSTPAAISDKVEAVGCEGQHKHFIGWVEEKDINADGSLKSGATIYEAGQSGMCAEGKHYYAVWADEE